ncbi:MAG: DUF2779 domain-containing protein [Bacteroidota bacterium]
MKVLTKSRFKLGLECPNKLFYTNKDSYANTKVDDPFLEALADGGFQVEELSRLLIPDGKLLTGNDYDYELLWQQTRDLLSQENVVIYEAAVLYKRLFIRADIVKKEGNTISLIEVKAKSFDPNNEFEFLGKQGGINSDWKSYLFDLAFQKFVFQRRFPTHEIKSYLMLADKSKKATVNRLNQLFRIKRSATHRTGIEVIASDNLDIGDSIMTKKDMSEIVEGIINDNPKFKYFDDLSFIETIRTFRNAYEQDDFLNWPTAYTACNKCEFKTIPSENDNLDSGYEHCFKKLHNWKASDFKKPAIIDIGNLHWSRGRRFFNEGKFFMEDITKEDLKIKKTDAELENDAIEFESAERNWIQIRKVLSKDTSLSYKKEGLKNEMKKWKFPLHFIDFETSTSALPFHIGRRPYEQIAFQYSHHTVDKDGHIEHASQYLNVETGVFPNFDFVRALKRNLEKDEGSIFRYADHENTVLNAVIKQLEDSTESDKDALISFLKTITHSSKGVEPKWNGEREMIDLLKVVEHYYFNVLTGGSNSIKKVLPAILATSGKLQAKYGKPLEGLNLTSINFGGSHVWIKKVNGQVQSPYSSLPPVFEGWTKEDIKNTVSEMETLADGGAALAAYGRLQYTNMPDKEKEKIKVALLKYCELDTLAMVMIYEHFLELIED